MRPSSWNRVLAMTLAGIFLASVPVRSQTYNVALNTGAEQALSGKVVFDLVVENGFDSFAQSFVYEFTTAGTMGTPETEGGLIQGDLILGANPAFFTQIGSEFYFNHLGVVLDPIGATTTFGVELITSMGVVPPAFPDAMSVYLQDSDDAPLVSTSDPTGADALFTLEGPSAILAVYDPAMFASPDSILFTSGIVDVPLTEDGTPRYLRFRNVFPNPARGHLKVRFDVPKGMERVVLEVFDLRGARVATLSKGPFEPGTHAVTWRGVNDRGRRMMPGFYMLRLITGGGHYVARKVMLIH